MDGDVFRHCYHERDFRLDGLFNSLRSLVSGHVDGRSIRLGFLLGLDIPE